jgi:membrane-associated protease RseP (regulator of RpoE activity)
VKKWAVWAGVKIKKAPSSDAPRRNLMIYKSSMPLKESSRFDVLCPGVILENINLNNVHSPAELLAAVKELKPGVPVPVQFSTGIFFTFEEFSAQALPAEKTPFIGFSPLVQSDTVYQNPFEQMGLVFRLTYSSLSALLDRNTDVGANQLMGVISIAKTYLGVDSLPQILWFTILINISLAILNILPIPILDGGHIAFATLQKIRGKPIPANLHAGIHYVFMLLIVLGMSFVLFNDVKRCSGDDTLDTQRLIHNRYVLANLVFTDEKPRQSAPTAVAEPTATVPAPEPAPSAAPEPVAPAPAPTPASATAAN